MNETEFLTVLVLNQNFKYFEKFTLKDYSSEDYARELHPPKKSRYHKIHVKGLYTVYPVALF